MAVATRKPEMVGTVWTASASLLDSSGKVIARCIDTPNAIAKALMEMPQAKVVKGLEGTHDREHWESRMKPWNNAKSGLIKLGGNPNPGTKTKVKGITYYRGVSRHAGMEAPTGERRRPSVYLTKSEREAKFYGKDIEKVTVDPKNPMYSETAVDAAEKLGVIKDYDKYIGSDPIKADEVIYNAAKKAGYDAIIRRDGDWVQVIDKGIISPVGRPTPEAKEPWKMTQKEWDKAREELRADTRQVMWTKASGSQETGRMKAVEKLLYGVHDEDREKVIKAQKGDIKLSPQESEALLERLNTRVKHKDVIEKALKEGKPVPAEVLKDYPELGKKETEGERVAVGNLKTGDTFKVKLTGMGFEQGAVWKKIDESPRKGVTVKNVTTGETQVLSSPAQAVYLAKPPAKPEPKAEGKGKKPSRSYDRLLVHLGGSNRLLARQREAFQRANIPVDIVGSVGTGHWSNMFAVMPDTPEARTLLKQVKGSVMRKQWSHLKAEPEAKPPEASSRTEAEPKKKPKLLGGPARFKTAATKQSDRAIAIDRALLARQVVSVDDPRWLKQPNRFDVRGIDTPGSGRVTSRTGFTDKGKTRMSRKHHRGWKRIKL